MNSKMNKDVNGVASGAVSGEIKKLCGEILQKFLKKHDLRTAKQVETGRRISLSPTEIYRNYHANNADMSRKTAINEAVCILEAEQLISVNRLKYSDEIDKMYMSEEAIDRTRVYVQDVCGITPRSRVKEQVLALLEGYEKDCGELTHEYCTLLHRLLDESASEISFSQIEANLKMIDFLEKNRDAERLLYVREASILVYGDSKWFQENNYEEVCNLLRILLGLTREEFEPVDEILEQFWVVTGEQEILLKGAWHICWRGLTIDADRLQGGIAISSADIPYIKYVDVDTEELMTIENKTSFQRMDEGAYSYMYLGGYANRHQILFLKKVIEYNPHLRYVHFGDIDAGGFLIHQNLCMATGKHFEMYRMGVSELSDERFAGALKSLTANDVTRLNTLAEKPEYRETVEYMLTHNCKLEQEIVSLTKYHPE